MTQFLKIVTLILSVCFLLGVGYLIFSPIRLLIERRKAQKLTPSEGFTPDLPTIERVKKVSSLLSKIWWVLVLIAVIVLLSLSFV